MDGPGSRCTAADLRNIDGAFRTCSKNLDLGAMGDSRRPQGPLGRDLRLRIRETVRNIRPIGCGRLGTASIWHEGKRFSACLEINRVFDSAENTTSGCGSRVRATRTVRETSPSLERPFIPAGGEVAAITWLDGRLGWLCEGYIFPGQSGRRWLCRPRGRWGNKHSWQFLAGEQIIISRRPLWAGWDIELSAWTTRRTDFLCHLKTSGICWRRHKF